MKKILFWSAVTIITAVSCNKIENDTPVQSNVPTFTATVDGAMSKTIIDGMKSYWNGTERIWVMTGESADWKKAYKVTATKQENVTFKEESSLAQLKGDDYLAIYPADPAGSVTWDGNISNPAKKFWLSATQNAVAGSYDPSTHIAVAYTKAGDENLEFKNVISLVQFTLGSDNVSEVCFYGNNSDVIAGNFDVKYNDGDPTCTSTGNGYVKETYTKIVAPTGKTLTKGTTYYISVLPHEFSKGFTAEIVVDGSKTIKKNSNKYILSRNQVLELGSLVWSVPQEAGKKTIYFKPKGWANDSAWFDAWVWGGGDQWVTFKKTGETGIYYANVPSGTTQLKMYRRSPSHTGQDWDGNQWNNSGNLSLNGKNYIVEGNNFGSFSVSNK